MGGDRVDRAGCASATTRTRGGALAGARSTASTQAQGGFTLVEVLVALTILSIIAIMTWRTIDGTVRTQQATQEYTDGVLTLQAALGQWRADLDAMVIWPDAGPGQAAPPTSLAWDGRMLRITRSAGAASAPGVRVVAWARRSNDGAWLRWQSDTVASQQGWRAAWDGAARWADSGAADATSGAQAVTVAHLLDWQLHYFRGNAWTNPLSSAAVDSGHGAPPDAIRLLATLAPGQPLAGPLVVDWIRPDFGGGP